MYHCFCVCLGPQVVNTLRLRQDGRRFPDDTFERIFLKENVIILIKISLKFVPNGPIDNIAALVQIMAWRQPGDKPLSEPMLVRSLTHICVTRPQWYVLVTGSTRYNINPLLWWHVQNFAPIWTWLNIKTSYQYRKYHCGLKDHLISTMAILTMVRWHLYIESASW